MNNHVKSEESQFPTDQVGFSLLIQDRIVSFERETAKEKRKLIYDPSRCTGCGLCADACPMKAIELGPLGAITTGQLESPHITIDPQKCVLCGICSAVCMFNSIDMEINGNSIKNSDDYLRYESKFEFFQDKCKMKDEERKILCKDCEEACPKEAIEAKLVEVKGKIINSIDHFDEKCIRCSSCEKACPQDAIAVRKVFDGKVEVDLDICQGCGVCVEICPSRAISMPRTEKPWSRPEKIVIDNDICVFCGACEKACPVDAIKVGRSAINYLKSKDKSWTTMWEKAFNSLVGGE
jgi:4Fe-4S ferredoxin